MTRYRISDPYVAPKLSEDEQWKSGRDSLIAAYWSSHPRLRFLKWMTPPQSCILDVGCGPGPGLAFWLPWKDPDRSDVKIFGLDIEDRGQPDGYAAFRQCDLNVDALPFPDVKFDAVLISHVLEHVSSPRDVLAKTYAAVNIGGRIYVEIPDLQTVALPSSESFRQQGWPMMISNFFDDCTHLQTYSERELAEFGAGAGLELESSGLVVNEFLADQMIDYALRNADEEVMLYGYWLATRWARYAIFRKAS